MRTIEATAVIEAPPAVVWDALVAGGDYRHWNPFITEVSGQLEAGARPRICVAPPGRKPMRFRPRVVEASPPTRLRWIGRLGLPRLCDGEHEFVLTELPDGTTELRQRETFRGVLVPLLGGMLEPTRSGFETMHEALRRRVVPPLSQT